MLKASQRAAHKEHKERRTSAALLCYNQIMENYLKQFEKCLQHEPSFCSAACPFNMDVDAFISRLQEGRFNAAYKSYRDATGFPFIAAEICTAHCRESCLCNAVRGGNADQGGDAIDLLALERATLAYATRIEPTRYNVPGKNKSAAIIGAGISGMACALRLATKKYNVTIYEKTDRTGGTLLDEIDSDIVREDFARQMEPLNYTVRFNSEVTSLDDVIRQGYKDNEDAAAANASGVASVMRAHTTHGATDLTGTYDAIYIATGKGGNDFGIGAGDPESGDGLCTLIGETAVFLGGSLVGADKTQSLADGLRISTAIDNYTLTKLLKYPEYQPSNIAIDETQYVKTTAVKPSGALYSKEEAVEEAKRCMKCQCKACRLHCDLTDYLHKWPLRLKDEIIATTAPGKSELHATPAVRTINMCTHCGLCRETCPEDIDLDGLIQAARIRMHKLDKMPWGFNDFFLRDMSFTNSEAAYVCLAPEDAETNGACRFAFFPGCQLGASSPELVLRSYELLLKIDPSTGIMIGCCGVPAQWAGDEELQKQALSKIRADWERLNKPTMILACPTCRKTFSKFLPEIKTTFIYDVIAAADGAAAADSASAVYAASCNAVAGSDYSVFDACSTAADDSVRTSVRRICERLGIKLTPLPVQEKWTACCSYGGHGDLADPAFTKFVREKRISEGELPYITYCINCRDSFLREGKEAVHVLDLLFGLDPRLVTVTRRRENRTELKEKLLRIRGVTATAASCLDGAETIGTDLYNADLSDAAGITLEISDAIRQKLSSEYILESEVADVVGFCERTGRTIHDTEADTFTGYRKIGNLTYWVEYRRTGTADTSDTSETSGTYELLNAYTHRMEIELEMIWNGEKIDIER